MIRLRKFETLVVVVVTIFLFWFYIDSQTTMGKGRRFGQGLETAFKAASSNLAILRGRKTSYSRP